MKMKRLGIATLLIFFVMADSLAAASLLDYEKRVARATEQIERIMTDENYSEEGASVVKKLLPASEQVEANGKIVTVDNRWLHTKLDAARAENNPESRVIILNGIFGSLQALDLRLIDAEDISRKSASQADSREKLKQILAQEQYREKQENPITKFIRETRTKVLGFLYKIWNKIMTALFGASGEASGLFRIIFFGFVLIASYFIIRMLMKIKPTRKKPKKQTILGEEIDEDTKPGDLADAALAAAKSGDFRSGVRKLYIALLYEMSERNLIELDTHLTNREYLAKASRFAQLAPSMKYLTDRFDFIWYGMFPSTQEDFISYLEKYREAVNKVQSISTQTAQTS
jgi:hypothetical protein